MPAPQMQNIRPAYQVHRLEGTVKRPIRVFADGKIKTVMREEPAGFVVYFPQGTSLRVRNAAELERYNLTDSAPLIDMATGEPFFIPQVDLKAEVERKTSRKGRVGESDVVPDVIDEEE